MAEGRIRGKRRSKHVRKADRPKPRRRPRQRDAEYASGTMVIDGEPVYVHAVLGTRHLK